MSESLNANFIQVDYDGNSERLRFVRTVSGNMWVSALYRETGFGWWEWETAICTHEPRTCNIVSGDRREDLAKLTEPELKLWYTEHCGETNSMETTLAALQEGTK